VAVVIGKSGKIHMKKPAQTIGKYSIERQLGSGTMGTVYLGYDSILDQRRAIKVMKSGVEDEELRKRFFREAQAAAKLDHPNIMRILDLDLDVNNHPYIVMEYVEGDDLKTYIDQRRFLPFASKLKIISEVCAGLDHAHEKGIIHRDVKPGNIRINRNGVAKVLDFGLARLESAERSRTGGVIGSPYYMSPEQWRGIRDLDRRSDLFSIAAVLYGGTKRDSGSRTGKGPGGALSVLSRILTGAIVNSVRIAGHV
jgi:serine/threonine protein kinase